jgi:hypothetical protein
VCFANWPARQVGQLTVAPPGRAPVTLTLWAAEPVIELPFTTDTAWVRCMGEQRKLHGRAFGSGVGRVAVSPDLSQAVVHNSFEGGEFPAFLFDLRTGEARHVNRWTSYSAWTMHRWRTALEPLSDEALMRELRSGDGVRFQAAADELERRPFLREHWVMYADVALDPNVPADRRAYVPYMLYHGDDAMRYEDRMSALYAMSGDADADLKVRAFASWALCELAQIEPTREFDLIAISERGGDAMEAEIAAVRAWWSANAKPEYRGPPPTSR